MSETNNATSFFVGLILGLIIGVFNAPSARADEYFHANHLKKGWAVFAIVNNLLEKEKW